MCSLSTACLLYTSDVYKRQHHFRCQRLIGNVLVVAASDQNDLLVKAAQTGSARCALLADCERQLLEGCAVVPLLGQNRRLLVAEMCIRDRL